MSFCPVITDPSAKPAAMWWAKFELNTGRTTTEDGTAQMLDSKYTAASKLPVKRRALFQNQCYSPW
jgi:hypothetical protein